MRIGIVGDIHEPFCHPMYRQFCYDVFDSWGVDRVHLVGDVVDNHAISFHDPDPNGFGAFEEACRAHEGVQKWYDLWPDATVSIGNHDERHFRRARKDGVPDRFLKTFREVWGTPNWTWEMHRIMDGVRYQHGTGSSGKDAAVNQAVQRRTSVVQGHTHSWAGVKHHANDTSLIFGMNVGCGIDIDTYAMAYAKDFPVRPVLGCGVVLDGTPYFEPMPCGPKSKYHKSKAKNNRRRKRG
jgi:predicted phosphodiesterase